MAGCCGRTLGAVLVCSGMTPGAMQETQACYGKIHSKVSVHRTLKNEFLTIPKSRNVCEGGNFKHNNK